MATYHVSYTAAQIEAAIGKTPIIQNGEWYVWDVIQMQYVPTGVDSRGISPTVEVDPLGNGHRVTITDISHPDGQSFDVLDGTGAGDMRSDIYDPDSVVALAGGIVDYAEATANRVTSITSSSTDATYPTAKAVYDLFNSITNLNGVSF